MFTDAKGNTIPTIGDVAREERSKLQAAKERDGMVDACSLKDLAESRANGNTIDYFLWLGGFDRFALIGSIRADWWVHEPKGYGQSWCCCPTDRVYRKLTDARKPEWTIERVKADLPGVKVLYNGRESMAAVRGRALPFAKLLVDEFPGSVEVAWQTIVDCLNADKPVRI